MNLSRTTNLIVLLIAIVYILIVGQDFLIPLILSILLWYLLKEVRDFLRKIKFVRNVFPMWVQNIAVFVVVFMVLSLLSTVISSGITEITAALPIYENNVSKIITQVQDKYNIDAMSMLNEYSSKLTELIGTILNSLLGIVGDGFIVVIYCIFLLMEESMFRKKFTILLSGRKEQFKYVDTILDEIDQSFSQYFFLKTIVSLLTGILSFIVLKILDVDAPILWCTIIFLFNYIPNIGSLVATTLPAVIAMLQFGDITPGLWVLAGVGIIQWFVANVIEPRLMGNSLNISPFVVILALILWNAIWGVAGMFMSVPIMVMLIIIFSKFESTKGIAIMLSESGNV